MKLKRIVMGMLIIIGAQYSHARPFLTESANVTVTSKLVAELEATYDYYNKYHNSLGDYASFTGGVVRNSTVFPISLRYGIHNDIEAGLSMPFISGSHTTANGTNLKGTGVGDLSVFGKAVYLKGFSSDFGYLLSFALKFNLPIGASVYKVDSDKLSLGIGAYEIMPQLLGSLKFSEWIIDINFGWGYSLSHNETKIGGSTISEIKVNPGSIFNYTVSFSYLLSSDWKPFFEIGGYYALKGNAKYTNGTDATDNVIAKASPQITLDENSVLNLGGGVEYKLADGISATVEGFYPIKVTNNYSGFSIGLGMSYEF